VVECEGEGIVVDVTVAGFVERETMVAEVSTSWSDVIDAGRHKADAPDAITGSRALFRASFPMLLLQHSTCIPGLALGSTDDTLYTIS
jgi:hypothetical protein